MEITGNHPFNRLDAYLKTTGKDKSRTRDVSEEAPKGGASAGDRVALSPEAREMQRARKLLDAIPDIREDRVTEIKARIEEGTYEIDGDKIAAKMIRESILNELL